MRNPRVQTRTSEIFLMGSCHGSNMPSGTGGTQKQHPGSCDNVYSTEKGKCETSSRARTAVW